MPSLIATAVCRVLMMMTMMVTMTLVLVMKPLLPAAAFINFEPGMLCRGAVQCAVAVLAGSWRVRLRYRSATPQPKVSSAPR